MPRDNTEPFPCKDCRFRSADPFHGHMICRRNPPICSDCGDEFPMVWLDGRTDCFAGEPRVRRSCATCKHDENDGSMCMVSSGFDLDELDSRVDTGWYCSDWEAKDGDDVNE